MFLPHYKHVLMTLFPTFSKMERKESKINFWCTPPRRTKEFYKLMKSLLTLKTMTYPLCVFTFSQNGTILECFDVYIKGILRSV